MSYATDIAASVWTAGTRTLASGSPATPTITRNYYAEAVWEAATREINFLPVTPADLATDQSATPTLTWEGGTANYTVQINEEALGEVVWADPTYEATGIATTSHAVTTTLPPGLYYWRVVDANGGVSEVWEFTVTAATDGHSRTGLTLGLGLGL